MEKLTLLMREAFCWFSTSLKQTYTHRSSAHWDFTACSFLFSFCWSIIVRALPGRYAPQTPTGACAGRRAPELLGPAAPAPGKAGAGLRAPNEHHHCGLRGRSVRVNPTSPSGCASRRGHRGARGGHRGARGGHWGGRAARLRGGWGRRRLLPARPRAARAGPAGRSVPGHLGETEAGQEQPLLEGARGDTWNSGAQSAPSRALLGGSGEGAAGFRRASGPSALPEHRAPLRSLSSWRWDP